MSNIFNILMKYVVKDFIVIEKRTYQRVRKHIVCRGIRINILQEKYIYHSTADKVILFSFYHRIIIIYYDSILVRYFVNVNIEI